MLVSVIVPLYNKAKYIKRALDSIAQQSHGELEVIVVDDGSSDAGDEIVADYGDPRFRLVKQANAGPGAARNRGVREARSSVVAFLDADDCWRPGYLETNVRHLEKIPEAAGVSGGWIDYPGEIPSVAVWSKRGVCDGLERVSAATPVQFFNTLVTYMTPSMVMMRREIFERFGGYYEHGCRYAEDSMLWVKILLHAPVYFHLETLTEFHREASELSRNKPGPRPVEPYLTHPEVLRDLCPPELRNLLESFYALRACKTACVLGYWSQWRQARILLNTFVSARDRGVPLFLRARVAGTPVGAAAGWMARRARRAIS